MQMHAFSRFLSPTNPTLLLNGTPLGFTYLYQYLRLQLSSTLSWNTPIKKIVASANWSWGYIRRNFKSARTNPKRLRYVTLVRHKLEYASAIWHHAPLGVLTIQFNLCRTALRSLFCSIIHIFQVCAERNLNFCPSSHAVESPPCPPTHSLLRTFHESEFLTSSLLIIYAPGSFTQNHPSAVFSSDSFKRLSPGCRCGLARLAQQHRHTL